MGFSRQEYWSGLPLPSRSVVMRLSHIAGMVSSVSAVGVLEHVRHKRATTAEEACAVGQAPDRKVLSGIFQGETKGWESPGNCLVMSSKTLRVEIGTYDLFG